MPCEGPTLLNKENNSYRRSFGMTHSLPFVRAGAGNLTPPFARPPSFQLLQQRELRAFCSDHSIAVVAYCSLGSGALLQDPTVQAVAASTGVTPAQALLLWGLRRGCAVIPKSADPRRIADVSPARLAQLWDRLTDDHLAALDALEAEQGQCKYAWDPSGIA